MRGALRHALLVTMLCAAGCGETVGFLSVEIEVPEISPPLEEDCAQDPRRVGVLSFTVDCGGERYEDSAEVGRGVASLSGVPLGRCTLTVSAINQYLREIYRGEQEVVIEEGESDPVLLSLTDVPCLAEDGCFDADNDELPDGDEETLGTNPNTKDSDGDGISDYLELISCCSDPTDAASHDCKLQIQEMLPFAAPPGSGLALVTTAPFSNPTVTIGDQRVASAIGEYRNSTVFLGFIDGAAVLGDVTLENEEGIKARYEKATFAVLRNNPETLLQLEEEASVLGRLPMAFALDSAAMGQEIYLLGSTVPTNLAARQIGVMRYRYRPDGGHDVHTVRPSTAGVSATLPVAIDARDGLVAVLAYEDGAPVIYSDKEGLGELIPKRTPLPIPDALSIMVEPGGTHVLITRIRSVLRVDLNDTANPGFQGATMPAVAEERAYCTGAAFYRRGAESYAFLSCFDCERGSNDPTGACTTLSYPSVVRFGPLESCFSGADPSCWPRFGQKEQRERTIGAPVVFAPPGGSPQDAVVYYVTASGKLFAHPAASDSPAASTPRLVYQPKPELLKSPYPEYLRHPLRVDSQRGLLYALAGPRIFRFALREGLPVELLPIVIAGEPQVASSIALSANGATLAIARVAPNLVLPSDLLHVCIGRCAFDQGCACTPPPGPTPP